MSGAVGCRGASRSEQLDDKELRSHAMASVIWSGFAVSLTPSISINKSCGIMLISKGLCSLLHRCNTVSVVPHMAL